MPELVESAPREEALTAARLNEEGVLWPWVARFLWAPALDLHPSRRAALAASLPEAAWSNAASLRHLSRHILAAANLVAVPRWHGEASAFRLALLPAEPLARLARFMALALCGKGDGALNAAEDRFLAERAPLYWYADTAAKSVVHVAGAVVPESAFDALAGWRALGSAVSSQPEAIRRRFMWKLPLACDEEACLGEPPQASAALALAARILREFEEPWFSLFAKPAA